VPSKASDAEQCELEYEAGQQMNRGLDIHRDDLSGEQTTALLQLHLAEMRASSPAEHVFALDLSGLKAPASLCGRRG
jgi:hypothetical protein